MTKKEAAFALFKEGKIALSPEVKDFKLKSKGHSTFIGTLQGS